MKRSAFAIFAARLAACASVPQSKVDVSAGYETQLTTDVTGRMIQLGVRYPAMAREQPQTRNFGRESLASDAAVAGVRPAAEWRPAAGWSCCAGRRDAWPQASDRPVADPHARPRNGSCAACPPEMTYKSRIISVMTYI